MWAASRGAVWEAAALAYQAHREQAALLRARGRRADPEPRYAARQRMARIATEKPARPTWCGDRVHAVSARAERDLHIDLAAVWPYLWLTLPEQSRTEITSSREALTRASTLSAWALLYLVPAVWWWPAVLVAVAVAAAGRTRMRAATDSYALLLEAATRLHIGDLTRQFGLEPAGPLTPDIADSLALLLPSPPPPPDRAPSPGPPSRGSGPA
ncbi:hypothetical protein [Streptomyces fuscigenes]|uniref:hypothetical protein n=1 Tax=Streptomyces fuscigenes TaxID=1528880 RepID=UPI001F3618B3|nr:hypothetical protein [Streptomyces fuscigenes]MCF3960210.1 hypothetical protein [Streptomyces fuscigenes]